MNLDHLDACKQRVQKDELHPTESGYVFGAGSVQGETVGISNPTISAYMSQSTRHLLQEHEAVTVVS